MKTLWSLDINTLMEYYELISYLERENERQLTNEEREIAFLQFVKDKEIKPIGHTELTKEEYIKEIVSQGKKILNIDKDGIQIIKKKEKEND